ncbi:MAG TPA: SUF system NifU family Fe-S cluster assembly protein [Rudaea sp.]|jgi:nitrogen fixation NifU-like protein
MTAAALYTQIVLEHQRAPRNFGVLEAHSHAADGTNPLCGDALRIELVCCEGRIERMHFHGEACAIAVATASMLSELAVGKSLADVARMETAFARLVDGSVAHDALLAHLNAMQALSRYPTRRKCALLAFATLRAALAGTASATTEGNG